MLRLSVGLLVRVKEAFITYEADINKVADVMEVDVSKDVDLVQEVVLNQEGDFNMELAFHREHAGKRKVLNTIIIKPLRIPRNKDIKKIQTESIGNIYYFNNLQITVCYMNYLI